MSGNAAFQKRVIERKHYTLDYTCWLDTTETLSDYAIGISPPTEPPLSASGSYPDTAMKKITTYLEGGKLNTVYVVSFIASTSTGQIKRDDIQMRVT